MKSKKYVIPEISAQSIIATAKNTDDGYSFYFDATDISKEYLVDNTLQDDCPIFYQAMLVLGEMPNPAELVSDKLRDVFVYIDFSGIFDRKPIGRVLEQQRIAECMFRPEGIVLNFGKTDARYVAFERSASMSRENRLSFVRADGATKGEDILWEPGATYKTEGFRIANKGNLALKYKLIINGVSGDASLVDAIEFKIVKADGTVVDLASEESLLANTTSDVLYIQGHMKETAGNECQGKSLTGLGITVYATQYTYESDSNNNQYDSGATLPRVSNNAELNEMLNGTDNVNVFLNAGTYTIPAAGNKTVNIIGTKNTIIDMANSAMSTNANANLDITFDGVTVKFANADYKGIKHSKAVTYKNCTLEGKQFMYAEDVKFENCTFINYADYSVWTYGSKNVTFEGCTFISGGKAILIYTEDSAYNGNIKVNNCTFCSDGSLNTTDKAAIEIGDSQPTAGLKVKLTTTNNTVYGFKTGKNTTTTVYGNKNNIPANRLTVIASNNTEISGAANAVSNAEELKIAMLKGENIVLLNDITVDSWESVKVGTSSVYEPIADFITIDGAGHSISGLNCSLLAPNAARYITVKNLTIKDSNVGYTSLANGENSGALLAYADNTVNKLIFDNCHTVNVNVTAKTTSGSAGALVGYCYTHATDGLSAAEVKFTNCTVKGGSVTSNSNNAAGIVGFLATKAGESRLIENCKVEGCTIAGENLSKTGAIVGTVNNNGVLDINNCTFDNTYKVIGRNTYNGSLMATVNVDGVSVTY